MSLNIHPTHQFGEPVAASKTFESIGGQTVEGQTRTCLKCQGTHFQAPGHEAIDLRLSSECEPPASRNGMTLY